MEYRKRQEEGATRKERKRSLIEEGKREREEKEKEERKGSEVIRKNRESTKKQRKFRIVITRGNMFIFLSYYISFVGSLASFFFILSFISSRHGPPPTHGCHATNYCNCCNESGWRRVYVSAPGSLVSLRDSLLRVFLERVILFIHLFILLLLYFYYLFFWRGLFGFIYLCIYYFMSLLNNLGSRVGATGQRRWHAGPE